MSEKKCSIVFTGDIDFDKYMDKKWEDENLLFEAILDFFRSADHVCANVEGALYEVLKDKERSNSFHAINSVSPV